MARGKLRHDSIAAAPAVRGERAIGWTAHYLIGVAFASILPVVCGKEWIREPTLAARDGRGHRHGASRRS